MMFRGVTGTVMARHNPTTKQTRLAYGSEDVIVEGKDLTDDSLWPVVLIFEESDVSVKLELLKPVGQEFILNVCGRGYESVTFRALYGVYDNQKEFDESLNGKMTINEHIIFDARMKLPFSVDNAKLLIDASTGGDKVQKIVLEDILCSK